jgi:hypothetical protein
MPLARRLLIRRRDYAEALLNTPGLVSAWGLNEKSGLYARDLCGRANGTYTGGPTLGAPGLLVGDPGSAIALSGAGQWVSLPAFGVGPGITLLAWGATVEDKNEYLITHGSDAYLRRNTSAPGNRFTMSWLDAGSAQRTLSSGSVVPADSKAHMLVGTHDGVTASVYGDGLLASSTALYTFKAVPSGAWGVGSTPTGSTDFWHGSLAHVAIFNRALSASEIKTLYQIGKGL